MYYLDTCICVEFLRGRLQSGYQVMRSAGPSSFALPAIVVAELFYGAEHSQNPEQELRVVESFVSAFEEVPFDGASAREYGRLRQELAAAGNPIGDRDTMIAAMALANGAAIVTNNMKDFSRVPGLKLEVWDEIDTNQDSVY